MHGTIYPRLFIRVNLADIKAVYVPTPTLISTFHSSHCSSIQLITHLSIRVSQHPASLFIPTRVSQHPASPFIPTEYLLYPMVSTRTKNKLAHPAAPVMTEAAKQKAGIKTKRRPKKATKDETIRELQAQIAALKNPGEESFSKEPLVCTTYPVHVD